MKRGCLESISEGCVCLDLGEAAACSSAARTGASECAPARGSLGTHFGRLGPVSAAMRAVFGCGADFAGWCCCCSWGFSRRMV